MKRSFNQIALIAALLLTLSVSTSFAANTTDNGGVTASFRKDFKQAEVLSTDPGKDYTKIATTPHGNTLLELMAEATISNEKLGQGKTTDMLAVSFSSAQLFFLQ